MDILYITGATLGVVIKRTVHHDDVIEWKHFTTLLALCDGESTRHRWIPLTKASDMELWWFLWSVPEQMVEQTIDTLVVWDAITVIMTLL